MAATTPTVILKPGHVQPIWSGHPWVFSQAVQRIQGGALPGQEVSVIDPRGNFLGRGYYSPDSAIVVRIATRNPDVSLDSAWLRKGLSHALALRHELGLPSKQTNGFRLVHSEGDLLPGLIVDRLNNTASIQLTTIGMQSRRDMICDAIGDVFGIHSVVDRTPGTYAKAEGFEPDPGVVRGDTGINVFQFAERELQYEIPLEIGQKTGFYFDQRPLRGRVEQLSRGRRVLDAFCFVGSFAMAAARGGASQVVAVDNNVMALETGARCAALNGLADRISFSRGSVRDFLSSQRGVGQFDLVILDPPGMAPSHKDSQNAGKAIRWLVGQACRVIKPGGVLVLSSCSAAIDLESLTRILAIGATDSRTQAVILERWFQGADHPVNAAFSEGLYLKSLIARIDTN
ncbi:MAG: class I SAM-dependent rRNA methyltransferase [Polyangiaceae bacterium]|nr:class I SAM-dependent rRNA methyltransferase [Polyangiaceae bacterium]